MPPFLTDRTTIETDWKCGMKRWWYKHEGGDGIVPTAEAEYFKHGKDIHEDLAQLMEGTPLQEVLNAIDLEVSDQIVYEVNARRAGLATGFALHIMPFLHTHYDLVATEREGILVHNDLWVGYTPDLILRRKTDKKLVMIDYKSTGTVSPGWASKWPFQVQMHLNMKGISEDFDEEVAVAYVLGLYKGYLGRTGRLHHPYVYAYKRGEKWGLNGWNGWEPVPATAYPGGIVEWVRFTGDEGKGKTFIWSSPIYRNDRLLSGLLCDRERRERNIARNLDACRADLTRRAEVFEPRYSECTPTFGPPCPYRSCCWNATIGADPLGSGEYVKREPHHEVENV